MFTNSGMQEDEDFDGSLEEMRMMLGASKNRTQRRSKSKEHVRDAHVLSASRCES
ncbi:unnamed protein product, partial [Amoebophrya sp. A25]|eukprot:GSA25T00014023001.1